MTAAKCRSVDLLRREEEGELLEGASGGGLDLWLWVPGRQGRWLPLGRHSAAGRALPESPRLSQRLSHTTFFTDDLGRKLKPGQNNIDWSTVALIMIVISEAQTTSEKRKSDEFKHVLVLYLLP
jgi:hypothetical protein